MRSRHSTSRTNKPDHLSTRNCIAHRYQWLAHVEIGGDDTPAVIDVHNVPRKEKIGDERDHSAIRGSDWLTNRATEIDTKVPAGELAIEQSAGSERTCDDRCAWPDERRSPHRWRIMGLLTDLARSRVLSGNSRIDGRIRPRKAAVDAERLCDRWRHLRKTETYPGGFRVSRRTCDFSVRCHNALSVNRHATDCVPGARTCSDEMQRLACQ
jgi:hypothetical protein